MFTLPFMAYFGSRDVLRDYFNVKGFALTAWSVVSSVIVVNLIIFSYIWRAFSEPISPAPSEDIIQEESSLNVHGNNKKEN